MTLLFVDSFDHYVTADLMSKYQTFVAVPTISTGRYGSGLYFTSPGSTEIGRSVPNMSSATALAGFAFKIVSTTGDVGLFRFQEGATNHLSLVADTTNTLHVKLGLSTGAILASSSAGLYAANSWNYVEFKAVIADGTGGSVEVRLNGVTVINASGLDTRNGGAAGLINSFTFGDVAGNSGDDTYWDDFYIKDDATFLGDVRIEALFPTAEGNTIQLIPSTGTDNSALVDEAAPSTTDYVESGVVGEKDTYVFGDLTPTTGTVFGVQILPYAAKTDAGTRSIASIARLSGTEVDSTDKALSTSYGYLPDMRVTKPGGGAWSITDVNNAEFGVKVTA